MNLSSWFLTGAMDIDAVYWGMSIFFWDKILSSLTHRIWIAEGSAKTAMNSVLLF